MSALITIRAMRESMSAIERRIADFILDNAHLLRDYSSQQLASALGVSQSSVVKFCQRIGFKGYPDLKLSIHEEVARHSPQTADTGYQSELNFASISNVILQKKLAALEETLAINSHQDMTKAAQLIANANRIYIIGIAEDSLVARELALQLMTRGKTVISESDSFSMRLAISSIDERDLLIIVASADNHSDLMALAHHARDHHAKTISVTRLTTQSIHTLSDLALFVSANDKQNEITGMLYRFSLQHLFDCIYQLTCGVETP